MPKQKRLNAIWRWVKSKSAFDFMCATITLSIAIFGVLKFFWYEIDAYESRANVSSSLEWRPSNIPNQCEAVFTVEIQNAGVSSFDVSDIHVRAWTFNSAVLNGPIAYLSLDQMKSDPLFDSTDAKFKLQFEKTDMPFVGHYPAGTKFFRSFQWLVARSKDIKDNNAYFQIDFNTKDKQPQWFTAAWGPICGESLPTPSAIVSPSPSKTP
jgi:hypothetical protein